MSQPQPVEIESLSPQEIDYIRKSIEEVRQYPQTLFFSPLCKSPFSAFHAFLADFYLIFQEIGFLDESLSSLHFVVQRFGDARASLTALENDDEGMSFLNFFSYRNIFQIML